MTERLFQFIWQFQYFNQQQLETINGERLQIIHPGQHNTDQGPDFSNGKIRIDQTILAGTIELHLRSSDWNRHGHQDDCRYQNVILHVVWEHDLSNSDIPVLELKTRISNRLLQRYEDLMQNAAFIPCQQSIGSIQTITWTSWKERLLLERLLRKSAGIAEALRENKFHWEECFWWRLARNFGSRVNADTFEAIARSVPLTIIAKQKMQLIQLEALLLGQAGLLDGRFTEHYPRLLQKEYRFQQRKHGFRPVHLPLQFLRMRPRNFPTIRLAQLAMLLHLSTHLFALVLDEEDLEVVRSQFQVTANDYWHYHYRLDESSPFVEKKIGQSMLDNLVINTIAPMLFAYGHHHGKPACTEKALKWLRETTAEANSITRGFQLLGMETLHAGDSQALIELKNEYCNQRRCLECAVGNTLLKPTYPMQST